MNKKLYKQTIDSIKISDEAVEKAINAVKGKDTVGKVITMNTKKRSLIKPVSIIAASLVLLMAVGAFLNPFGNKENNSFSLIAYAAEKDGIRIGNDFVKLGTVGVTNTESYYDSRRDKYSFKASMNFDVKAEGDNIESLTYKIENADFILKKNNKSFVSKTGAGEKNIDLGSEENYKGVFDYVYDAYNSFTVDYNNQPERVSDENGFINSRGPILIYFKASEKDGAKMKRLLKAYCGVADKSEINDDEIEPLREIYNQLINKIKISITAKYKNGEEKTSNLVLSLESASKLSDEHDLTVNIRQID